MNPIGIIIALAAALVTALTIVNLPQKKAFKPEQRQKKIDEAKTVAQDIKSKAKERIQRAKKILQDEESDVQEQNKFIEETLKQKEELLRKKEQRNKSYEGNVKQIKKQLEDMQTDAEKITAKMIKALSETSGVTEEKAKNQVEQELENVITENREARAKAHLEEYEEEAANHAKAVLRPIIQRLGTKSSVDKNSTTVYLKSDKFKGALVGKAGRNIAYLESLLPISVIFNLHPMEIHVGGVNLIRRHIGKGAIQRLQKRSKKDNKITHEMIKKAVQESEKEIMGICDRKGKEALKLMDLDPSKVEPELINLVGRMYFRTSFGQNILQHSLEMAYLARLIAEQIGADVNTSMQAAFYHDIGKAIDHDVGGAHDDISKEILEKFGYDEKIVHAAYAHHDKVPCLEPPDFIVKAVDAISSARPGARQEAVTNYFERMKQLEDTAASFHGVKKVITMSAGREVRVMIDEKKVKDTGMQGMADDIAEKISEDLSFPGIIKVNLIRKSRAVDYARDRSKK